MLGLLSAALLFSHHHPRDEVVKDIRIGQWRLHQVTQKFTGESQCRLSKGNIRAEADVVYFDFGASVDASDATFRIDDAAPRRWRPLIPGLVARGVSIENEDLSNPSAGRVPLPLELLNDASAVEIKPNPNRGPTVFRLSGFASAMEAAKARGCFES